MFGANLRERILRERDILFVGQVERAAVRMASLKYEFSGARGENEWSVLLNYSDALSARARVTKNYVHKGHKFVEVDALVLANERTPLARVTHTAIYLPRQLAEALEQLDLRADIEM